MIEKYTSKFKEATSDLNVTEIIKQIDVKQIEKAVESRIGTKVKLTLSPNHKGDLINITSNELVNKTGIFKFTMETCKIETFSNSIDLKKNIWGFSLNYAFSYKSLGSNGCDLLSARYDITNNTFEFRDF